MYWVLLYARANRIRVKFMLYTEYLAAPVAEYIITKYIIA